MNANIPDAAIDRFNRFIVAQFGLHYPENRRKDLERNLLAAIGEFGFTDAMACLDWLTSAPLNQEQTEVLAHHLTTGETYFFREKRVFEVLEKNILPELIACRRKSGRYLRIWSAGCSTAEESYSIAILITRVLADWKNWNIMILATDINIRALRKASEGIYSEWSFRGAPAWLKEQYVRKIQEGRYQIIPEIKNMVTFANHNLVQDTHPSIFNNTNAMDIIICHNALMYFTRRIALAVVDNFHKSLIEGGWLTVGASEVAILTAAQGFEVMVFDGQTFFRKPESPLFEAARLNPDIVKPPPSQPVFQDHLPLAAVAPSLPGVACGVETSAYQEALGFYQQGRYIEAVKRLELIQKPEAFALLARSLANLGKLEEALQWCEKAIDADRLKPRHYYLRASILQEMGHIEEAVIALKRTLYLDARFILAHVALGHIARKQGKIDEMRRHFDNACMELRHYSQDEVLDESEGLTAGRLMEIIATARPENRS
ncbi:MAG: hypothetical protein PHE55_13000 [Methylococcaceae bacterium]|nr:hypothetical protein [Methylococcaceae bacterium]